MKNTMTIVMLIITLGLQAQTKKTTLQPHFGVKVGTNYSNVYDSKGEQFNADAKFGLAAGAFVHIPLTSLLGIQPEVLFSQKGFKGTGRILGSNYEIKRTSNFIDVPLLLAISPAPSFTIVVGPQFSFLTSQKDEFTGGGINTLQQQEFNNDNLRKNILGIVGGVDFVVQQALISLRAGWDTQTNNGDGTSSTPRYKNAIVQATVGFRL